MEWLTYIEPLKDSLSSKIVVSLVGNFNSWHVPETEPIIIEMCVLFVYPLIEYCERMFRQEYD